MRPGEAGGFARVRALTSDRSMGGNIPKSRAAPWGLGARGLPSPRSPPQSRPLPGIDDEPEDEGSARYTDRAGAPGEMQLCPPAPPAGFDSPAPSPETQRSHSTCDARPGFMWARPSSTSLSRVSCTDGDELPGGHPQPLFRAAERGESLIRDYLNCKEDFIYQYSMK